MADNTTPNPTGGITGINELIETIEGQIEYMKSLYMGTRTEDGKATTMSHVILGEISGMEKVLHIVKSRLVGDYLDYGGICAPCFNAGERNYQHPPCGEHLEA